MLAVEDLVSFAQIRSVLMCSDIELPNQVLADYNIYDDLAQDLDSWFSDWSSTADERKLRLYSKYFCALTILPALENTLLTASSDGTNSASKRNSDMTELRASLTSKLEVAKQYVIGNTTDKSSYSQVSISNPYRDVITTARS